MLCTCSLICDVYQRILNIVYCIPKQLYLPKLLLGNFTLRLSGKVSGKLVKLNFLCCHIFKVDACNLLQVGLIKLSNSAVFTALHGMQCRRGLYYDENVRPSVCLSVCPSVKRVLCDKTEERYVYIFISYERSFT